MEWLRGPYLIPTIAVFFLLGLILIFLTIKSKIKGLLRKFLILTGASAAGFFIFVLLHNLLYALAIVAENITVVKYLAEVLHIGSFLIAVLICPLGFLIGSIGSIVLLIKNFKYK